MWQHRPITVWRETQWQSSATPVTSWPLLIHEKKNTNVFLLCWTLLIWHCDSHIAPGPVSNLALNTTDSSLTANWVRSADNFSSFTVTLQLDESQVNTTDIAITSITFTGLKNSANYTVTVYSVSGGYKSPPMSSSIFTRESLSIVFFPLLMCLYFVPGWTET